TFPCSVCGKVFCHSSSLSRHRMQAHFKSYTCTQCNQEISNFVLLSMRSMADCWLGMSDENYLLAVCHPVCSLLLL
ncbi:hypothetical protein WUBG_03674, partial [Wuchereria bancrofti]